MRLKAHEKAKVEEWERVRWQAFVAARVAGSKVNHPQDLMKLPSDEERTFEAVVVSDEDIQALINIGLIQ